MENTKTIIAKAKFVKGSPRKLRLVADAVRPLRPMAAINALKAMPKRGAEILLAVYQQGMANAKNNFQMSPESLYVKSLQVHEGPRFKRRDVHAHGARYDSGMRHKKLAHVTLELISK